MIDSATWWRACSSMPRNCSHLWYGSWPGECIATDEGIQNWTHITMHAYRKVSYTYPFVQLFRLHIHTSTQRHISYYADTNKQKCAHTCIHTHSCPWSQCVAPVLAECLQYINNLIICPPMSWFAYGTLWYHMSEWSADCSSHCVYALIGIITSTVHVTFSALVRNYGHCTAAMLCHVALH